MVMAVRWAPAEGCQGSMSTCEVWSASVLLLRGRAARKSWNSSKKCSGYRTYSRPRLGWGSLFTNLQEVTSQIAQPFHLDHFFGIEASDFPSESISFIRVSQRPFQHSSKLGECRECLASSHSQWVLPTPFPFCFC